VIEVLIANWQASPLNPGPHSALNPVSPQASHIEWLYWTIFWIVLAAFVLTVAFATRAAAKNFVESPMPLPIRRTPEADRKALWAVGSAIAVTVITLFVVLAISVVTEKKARGLTTSKNPVSITIIEHQWWWEVIYPNSQADQTITTANEIHVPVGKPVVIQTNSNDVIHSFWAPNINGKRDLLPGYSTAFWFQVDQPGIYHGQCAEF